VCAAWPVYLRVRGVAGLLKPHAIRAAPRLLSQLLLLIASPPSTSSPSPAAATRVVSSCSSQTSAAAPGASAKGAIVRWRDLRLHLLRDATERLPAGATMAAAGDARERGRERRRCVCGARTAPLCVRGAMARERGREREGGRRKGWVRVCACERTRARTQTHPQRSGGVARALEARRSRRACVRCAADGVDERVGAGVLLDATLPLAAVRRHGVPLISIRRDDEACFQKLLHHERLPEQVSGLVRARKDRGYVRFHERDEVLRRETKE
jgi:hypothetical protein